MQVSFDHEKLFEGSGGFFCVSYTHEWAPVFGQNAFVHEEAVAEGERDRRDILCYKYFMFWTRYGAMQKDKMHELPTLPEPCRSQYGQMPRKESLNNDETMRTDRAGARSRMRFGGVRGCS